MLMTVICTDSLYKKDGHDIRFIVVKKPNSTVYGVGLDACQICGVAGYYAKRKNDIVCKRCGCSYE